jgi:hypothetical protein
MECVKKFAPSRLGKVGSKRPHDNLGHTCVPISSFNTILHYGPLAAVCTIVHDNSCVFKFQGHMQGEHLHVRCFFLFQILQPAKSLADCEAALLPYCGDRTAFLCISLFLIVLEC